MRPKEGNHSYFATIILLLLFISTSDTLGRPQICYDHWIGCIPTSLCLRRPSFPRSPHLSSTWDTRPDVGLLEGHGKLLFVAVDGHWTCQLAGFSYSCDLPFHPNWYLRFSLKICSPSLTSAGILTFVPSWILWWRIWPCLTSPFNII